MAVRPKSKSKAPPRAPRPTPTPEDRRTAFEEEMRVRVGHLVQAMVGRTVRVTSQDGEVHEGVFGLENTQPVSGEFSVLLKAVRTLFPPAPTQTLLPTLHLPAHRLLSLDLPALSLAAPSRRPRSFATDRELSGGVLRERELQPWRPEGEAGEGEELEAGGGGQWDQYAENERLFGMQSSYREELYTTALDRSDPAYARLAPIAERIEAEIMSGGAAATNTHLRLERGHTVEGDEEELHSAVLRYVPPPRRRAASPPPTNRDRITAFLSTPAPPPKERSASLSGQVRRLPEEPRTRSSSVAEPSPARTPELSLRKAVLSETVRVRMNLVQPASPKASPVSPRPRGASTSALQSPLVGDPKRMAALSLEVSSPRIKSDVIAAYQQFVQSTEPAAPTSRRAREIDSLRSFSSTLRLPSPSRAETQVEPPAPAPAPLKEEKPKPSSPSPLPEQPKETKPQPTPTPAAAPTTTPAAPAPVEEKKPKFSFKFNINAAAFVPQAAPATPVQAPPSSASPSSTPAPSIWANPRVNTDKSVSQAFREAFVQNPYATDMPHTWPFIPSSTQHIAEPPMPAPHMMQYMHVQYPPYFSPSMVPPVPIFFPQVPPTYAPGPGPAPMHGATKKPGAKKTQ